MSLRVREHGGIRRPVGVQPRNGARERARVAVDAKRREHSVVRRWPQRRLEVVVPTDRQALRALVRWASVQVKHCKADQAAAWERRRRVHVRAAIVGSTRLLCEPTALRSCRHHVPIAPTPSCVARVACLACRKERLVIAVRTRVGTSTRWPHVHAQSNARIGRKADLRESTAHAVAACIVRRVRTRVHHVQIEIHGIAARVDHLRHVHVPNAVRLRCVGPQATEVGPGKLGVEEVERKRAAADARVERRRRWRRGVRRRRRRRWQRRHRRR